MPDPDTMRHLQDAANGAASTSGGSQGLGAAIGAAVGVAGTVIMRAWRGDSTADAVRDEARKTREAMESIGTATHEKLHELSTAIAVLGERMNRSERR